MPKVSFFARLIETVTFMRHQRNERVDSRRAAKVLGDVTGVRHQLDERLYGCPSEQTLEEVNALFERHGQCQLLAIRVRWGIVPEDEAIKAKFHNPYDTEKRVVTTCIVQRDDGILLSLRSFQQGSGTIGSRRNSQSWDFALWAAEEGITIAKDTSGAWSWFSNKSQDPGKVLVKHQEQSLGSRAQYAMESFVEKQGREWPGWVERKNTQDQERWPSHLNRQVRIDPQASHRRLRALLPESKISVAQAIEERAAMEKELAAAKSELAAAKKEGYPD